MPPDLQIHGPPPKEVAEQLRETQAPPRQSCARCCQGGAAGGLPSEATELTAVVYVLAA